ncbi:hypothetical protein DDW02_01015 [Acidilobus sp. SCGC AC-742_M05]|nr:hypothetical protein DDW02_01015 [Acidilobus sp. SCGC AC-742_M05]
MLEVLNKCNVTLEMQRAFVNSVRFEKVLLRSALKEEPTIYRACTRLLKSPSQSHIRVLW